MLTNPVRDWDSFLSHWGCQYNEVRHILSYLKSYETELQSAGIQELQDTSEIDSSQKEWIRLCTLMTNPMEIEFLKPYWVPIQKNDLELYIDLSNPAYPLIEINYFFIKPYKWFIYNIVEDIRELMLVTDTGVDLESLKRENDQKRWLVIKELIKSIPK